MRRWLYTSLVLLLISSSFISPRPTLALETFLSIGVTSPNPDQGTVGRSLAVKTEVIISAQSPGTLLVTIGPSSSSYLGGYVDYKCLTYNAMSSQTYSVDLTLPSPGAPQSAQYRVAVYYRPQVTSSCPTFSNELPGWKEASTPYGVDWGVTEELLIIGQPSIQVHSTTAKITWITNRDSTTKPTLNAGEVIYQPYNLTKTHEVWVSKLLPGKGYGATLTSCDEDECKSVLTNFQTKAGCVEVGFYPITGNDSGNISFINPSTLKPSWGPLARDSIFEDAAESLPSAKVYVQAIVDGASASETTPKWMPAHTFSHIPNLSYKISIPAGYTDGGFDDPAFWDSDDQADLEVDGDLQNDGRTTVPYILPATIDSRTININASIISENAGIYTNYDCSKSSGLTQINNFSFHYQPRPIGDAYFKPISNEDVSSWSEIEDREEFFDNTKSVLADLMGYAPAIGTVWSISQSYQDIQEMIGSTPYDSFKELRNEFDPSYIRGGDLYIIVYNLAGVPLNGDLHTKEEMYYVSYAYKVVRNVNGQDISVPVLLHGVQEGLPYWLIERGKIALGAFYPSPLVIYRSFSPIRFSLINSSNSYFDQSRRDIPGVYNQYLENDGGIGEVMRVNPDTYNVDIQGLDSGQFSLIGTRPYKDRDQVIYFPEVPITIGQHLTASIPLNGEVGPILLPNGQSVWPMDVDAPTTQINPTPPLPDGRNQWYVHNITIDVTSEDNITGVDWINCQINHTNPFTYTQPFFVTEERADNQVTCSAKDKYGNWESPKQKFFMLDKTPPMTSIAITGTLGHNQWYTSTVQVALPATDNVSGVELTEYRLDGGDWQPYSSPFDIVSEGIHHVEYRSMDVAGNLETSHTQEIKIDRTPPALRAWLDQTNYLRLDNLILHYEASDQTSGIDTVTATHLGQPLQPEIPHELLWEKVGTYTITVVAMDKAGWTTTRTVVFDLRTTLERLRATILRLRQLGEIDRDGIVNGLLAKVDQAIAAQNRGKGTLASQHLEALIHELEGIRETHVTNRATDLLIDDSHYLQSILGKKR